MRLLRPHSFIAEIGDGKLQVGSAPPRTVIFSDLSAEETAWILSLKPDAPRRARRATPPSQDSPPTADPTSGRGLSKRQEEILLMLGAADLLDDGANPLRFLRVRIVGLDEVGARLARLLAAEGVAELELRDRRRITGEETRVFQERDLGRPRQTVLAQELRSRHPGLRVGKLCFPDVVVVCATGSWDHGALGRLLSKDLPHLPILQRDREVLVGPLIAPGKTGCAVCADLTIGDGFPVWAQTSLALAGATQPPTPDYLCCTAAGLAVSLLVCATSGTTPVGARTPATTGGVSHSFTVGPTGVTTQEWFPHRRCACQMEALSILPADAA